MQVEITPIKKREVSSGTPVRNMPPTPTMPNATIILSINARGDMRSINMPAMMPPTTMPAVGRAIMTSRPPMTSLAICGSIGRTIVSIMPVIAGPHAIAITATTLRQPGGNAGPSPLPSRSILRAALSLDVSNFPCRLACLLPRRLSARGRICRG